MHLLSGLRRGRDDGASSQQWRGSRGGTTPSPGAALNAAAAAHACTPAPSVPDDVHAAAVRHILCGLEEWRAVGVAPEAALLALLPPTLATRCAAAHGYNAACCTARRWRRVATCALLHTS